MRRAKPHSLAFYRRSAELVAVEVLGGLLERRLPSGERLLLRIVETEAYLGTADRASHAWAGRRTTRTETLYRDGGCAYVYLIYGLYHCLNLVTGRAGEASAVLVRAAEAMVGQETMARRRRLRRGARPGDLAGGPGKLCMACDIDRSFDGAPLGAGPLRLLEGLTPAPEEIVAGPRVGVEYAGEAAAWPLRFAVRGHPEVSRPHPW